MYSLFMKENQITVVLFVKKDLYISGTLQSIVKMFTKEGERDASQRIRNFTMEGNLSMQLYFAINVITVVDTVSN